MHRRSFPAIAVAAALALSSCSVVDELTGQDQQPAPSASADELVAGDLPVGTDWQSEDPQTLEDLVADHALAAEATIEPEECTDAALVTDDEDGNRAQVAGRTGRTDDGTALPVLVVVKGGRSVDDLRSAREDCDEITVTTGDSSSEGKETVGDGPEIDGADESFELDGTYKSTFANGKSNTLERYGIVAETRGVLVVVMANPDVKDEDSLEMLPINDATREAVAEIVRAQVEEIRAAR